MMKKLLIVAMLLSAFLAGCAKEENICVSYYNIDNEKIRITICNSEVKASYEKIVSIKGKQTYSNESFEIISKEIVDSCSVLILKNKEGYMTYIYYKESKLLSGRQIGYFNYEGLSLFREYDCKNLECIEEEISIEKLLNDSFASRLKFNDPFMKIQFVNN